MLRQVTPKSEFGSLALSLDSASGEFGFPACGDGSGRFARGMDPSVHVHVHWKV